LTTKDAETFTWRHLIAVISILSIVVGLVLSLGFKLFYPTTSAAALEVRVAVVERDLGEIKTSLRGSEEAQRQILTSQQTIISNLGQIVAADRARR